MADSDGSAKPPMPRRPAKSKPADLSVRKKDLEASEVEKRFELLTVQERACAHLAAEYSPEAAGEALGLSPSAVKEILDRPRVRLYLQACDEKFIEKLATAKVRALKKVGITAAAIEERLMQLAQMDPEDTRGNIDGQVKALRTLAEIHGLLDDNDPLKGKSKADLEAIIKGATRMLPGGAAPPAAQ